MFLAPILCPAQVDTGVKVTDKVDQGKVLDSVKKAEYPYIFPLFGKKLARKGFLLPYPIGVMVNAFQGSQEVTISDLSVGIVDANGGEVIPTISLDDVVGFGEVRASVSNLNVRADLWVLPFLDVYGIFGKAWVKTEVNINSIMQQPVDISTTAKFNGYVYGVGAMLTGGIRSFFFSFDFNKVWTHFDQMKNTNSAANISLRTGYIFRMKKAERNLAVWMGTGRSFLNSTTVGSVNLSDIAPDMGENYENTPWYQAMTPAMQALTDRVVDNFVDKNKGDVINYSLSKQPKHNWCMILGAQFQLDRRWQFRTEVNFLGGRRSGLISANYRFGIK